MEDETKQDVDKLDFTAEGETFGYISLDQARVLALRLAREDTSVYGDRYADTRFAWEVTSSEEGEDYYQIRVSFRPVQGFTGEPGTELFTIDKLGGLESRQVITFPAEKGRFPTGLLALGGIASIGAVIAVLFVTGVFSGDVTGAAGGQADFSQSVTRVLTAEAAVTVKSLDGDVRIDIPVGAVPGNAVLDYVPMTLQDVPVLDPGFIATNSVFDISITDVDGESVEVGVPVKVEVSLDSAIVSVAGSDPSRIVIQHHGGSGWEVLDTTVDLRALTASADTTNFSPFALTVKELVEELETTSPFGNVVGSMNTPEPLATEPPMPTPTLEPTISPTPTSVPTPTVIPTPTSVPTPTPSPYAKGESYRDAENWSMAIREYSAAIELDAEDRDAYFFRAYSYHQISNHWSAVSDYDQVLELRASAVAYKNRGDVYSDMGRYEQAIYDYTDAIKLDPDYAEAYNSRAIAENTLGKDSDWSESQACSLDSKYCPTPTPGPTPRATISPTPKPHGMKLSVNGIALEANQAVFNITNGLLVFDPTPDASGKYDQGASISVTAFPTVAGSTVLLGGLSSVNGNTGTIVARGSEWSMTATITLLDGVAIPVPSATAVPTPTPTSAPAVTAPAVSNAAAPAVNNAPVAVDDSGSATNGGTVEVSVTSNDSDPDGDTLTIDSVAQGTNGTVAITAGGVTYSHDGSDSTSDTFTYTVSDGSGGTATATVTVTIAAPAPIGEGIPISSVVYPISFAMGKDIYLVNSNGTGLANLTNNSGGSDVWAYNPRWSPDGTKIAYSKGASKNGNIYSSDKDGTNHVQLTDFIDQYVYNPRWSPNGTKILYELNSDIYVMNSDGSADINLTQTSSNVWAYDANWSPDGQYIAYTQTGDIYVMDADGSDKVNVTNSEESFYPWGAKFSPDSKTIFYSGGNNIWSVGYGDNYGVDNKNLTNHPIGGTAQAEYPRVSPDGSILSAIQFDSEYSWVDKNITIMRTDGTEMKYLLSSVNGAWGLEWSPEGSRLLYMVNAEGISDLYTINVDGTGVTKITDLESGQYPNDARWSPVPGSVSVVPPPLDWHLERDWDEVSLSETGSTATFDLNLWSQPESDVVLSVVSADTGEVTVSPIWLTFTSSNWEAKQTITLTGVDDDAEDGTQTTTITVSGVGDFWKSDQETLQVATTDDDATLPSSLTVAFDSGVDGEAWGNGTFSRCASDGSCGALQSGVFSGREVYVRPNANSSDPNSDWYWAYIFKKWDAETWIIQYVNPALTNSSGEYLWNAHRATDGENPWKDWGDLTVTANYD